MSGAPLLGVAAGSVTFPFSASVSVPRLACRLVIASHFPSGKGRVAFLVFVILFELLRAICETFC